MEDRIVQYRQRIDALLKKRDGDTDWDTLLAEHLVQIGFFQHERLVHLIVTVTFAVLEIISLLIALEYPQPAAFLLVAAILVLLVPYIRHYYILENETQKMYVQYDQLAEIVYGKNKNETDSRIL